VPSPAGIGTTESATDLSTSTVRHAKRGGKIGSKAAKAEASNAPRQHQAVRCLSEIGISLKRKSVALEESNTIQAFRIALDEETDENKEMKSKFLRAVRKTYKIIVSHPNAALAYLTSKRN
jgi:hypothetical protein